MPAKDGGLNYTDECRFLAVWTGDMVTVNLLLQCRLLLAISVNLSVVLNYFPLAESNY